MNIFFLDKNPDDVAEYHVDRHVIKMIQETAQILSTAHRVLDGSPTKQVLLPSVYRNLCTLGWTGRVDCAYRLLPGESLSFVPGNTIEDVQGWTVMNKQAMLATHAQHPSSLWARENRSNYYWLHALFVALCAEKDVRYKNGPNETRDRFGKFLSHPPKNLQNGDFTEPPPCMPAGYKVKKADGSFDSVASYRQYYIGEKYKFARWTTRTIPLWYLQGMSTAWNIEIGETADDRARYLTDEQNAKKTDITLKHVKKYLPDVYNRVVL